MPTISHMISETLTNKEFLSPICTWCGNPINPEELVYVSVADDLENPKPHHKVCVKALNYYSFTLWSAKDLTDEVADRLAREANKIYGIRPVS